MNMFDEARAMSGTLALCKITQKELALRLGVSQSYVANKLRLLSLPDDVKSKIIACGVSERHARTLLRLSTDEQRRELLEKITERALTVRECEAIVDATVDRDAPRRLEAANPSERISTFCHTLNDSIDTLRSLGIEAMAKTGYYGRKMYITICIYDV